MKVTFDSEVDAVYIYFVKPGTIKVSYSVELAHNLIADYDYLNKLIGLEILNASSLIGAPDSVKALEFEDLWEEDYACKSKS
jgi:uncharacterized protein YuzE